MTIGLNNNQHLMKNVPHNNKNNIRRSNSLDNAPGMDETRKYMENARKHISQRFQEANMRAKLGAPSDGPEHIIPWSDKYQYIGPKSPRDIVEPAHIVPMDPNLPAFGFYIAKHQEGENPEGNALTFMQPIGGNKLGALLPQDYPTGIGVGGNIPSEFPNFLEALSKLELLDDEDHPWGLWPRFKRQGANGFQNAALNNNNNNNNGDDGE